MAENGVAVDDTRVLENGLPEVLAEEDEEEHFGQIERDLDTLTFSGSTINDLELQLSQAQARYKLILTESKQKLGVMKQKLNTHIQKSLPFVEIWRKAREMQEASNKAAVRYDKASSQHSAAKEMITMAEKQLGDHIPSGDSNSSSPIDLAWQEMLNHATQKVVVTEKERRDSELEHKQILEECSHIMEEYRTIEKKLRSHIVKSRPYYEERFRCNQRLLKQRQFIQDLQNQIKDTKKTYASTLRRLETLNTTIHERRRSATPSFMTQGKLPNEEDPRQTASAGHSPVPHRLRVLGIPSGQQSNSESMESLQLGDQGLQFTGSTGSLPSIGTSSISDDYSPTPDIDDGETPKITTDNLSSKLEAVTYRADERLAPQLQGEIPIVKVDEEECTAHEVVARCLASAINRLETERRTIHTHMPDV